ncbi:MAG: hypothetical protein KKB31_07230 [Nanoarchaeota archaeon]|nr:hypothetical protein [Nanoarchaeota archaeon]
MRKGISAERFQDAQLIAQELIDFIELAEDHYWDTFELDRDVILKHIYTIILMVIKKKFNNYSEKLVHKFIPQKEPPLHVA